MNVGKIYLIREEGGKRWRMDPEEEEPRGDEFEEFSDGLSSFMDGYFFALGLGTVPAYARGDFFWERTEAIYFTDRTHLSEKFVHAVQRWLSVPRRSNWRVLIVGEKRDDNYIVVYEDAVVLAPGVESIPDAIYED